MGMDERHTMADVQLVSAARAARNCVRVRVLEMQSKGISLNVLKPLIDRARSEQSALVDERGGAQLVYLRCRNELEPR